ncbi:oxygenase MpaB family protein [Patulibacter minatonensis]|uniref:oxygenase MpaB family protein n=1 Tax=Patulibacter minatonensis TaxID=298163 RepID=UPI0004B9FE60|nr:oxygenase MpaB family protein [Patulibacter minatonensis]
MAPDRKHARWARDEIAALDPVVDNERITHLSAEVRFGDPALAAALYTVAFARQMAVPSIAAVVHRGGRSPIMVRTRKRNDDTLVFFGEFMRHGHSSPEGRAAIERLNEIHAQFPIRNDQSLYTLASLTFEAIRIPALLGADPLTQAEKDANFWFWRGVGARMHLTDMPESLDAFWSWMQVYEREHWAWSAGGAAVARAMIDDYAARWFPPELQRVGRELTLALMEDELLDVLHLKRPKARTRAVTAAIARTYFAARQVLPDPAERGWTGSFGGEYGGCPHMADVGYRPERDRPAARVRGCPVGPAQ